MLTKLFLALRNNGHQVNVIKINDDTKLALGISHPEEKDRRANVMRQWGMQADSPRKQRLATIDEPLPQRTQTILSHQLDSVVQQQINSGLGGLTDSRQHKHAEHKTSVQSLPDSANSRS